MYIVQCKLQICIQGKLYLINNRQNADSKEK